MSQSSINTSSITIAYFNQRTAGAGNVFHCDAWVAAGDTLHTDNIVGNTSINGVTINDILTVGTASANNPIVVNGQIQASDIIKPDASVWTDNVGANRNSLIQVDDHVNIGTTSTANNAPRPKNLAVYGSATFNGTVNAAAG